MDKNLNEPFFTAFSKDLSKQFLLSAVTTVSMIGGTLVMGRVLKAVGRRKARKSK